MARCGSFWQATQGGSGFSRAVQARQVWFGAIWLGPVRFFPAGGVRSGWVRIYLVRFDVAGKVRFGLIGYGTV